MIDTPASVRAIEQKLALHDQIMGARLPAKAIADIVGVSTSVLWGWADTSIDSHIPGARVPAILAAAPENPALVRYWAGLVGCTLVTLPRAGAERAEIAQLAELAGAFAALLQHQADASRDGRWTAREVEQLRPIATELAARALAHLQYAETQAKVEPLTPASRRSA